MLRGPFSGQFMIFMASLPSMTDRGRALFADLREVDEAVETERLDQVVRLSVATRLRPCVLPQTGVALKPQVPQPVSM